MQEEIQLRDIGPNPYRAIEAYPIQREKVERLKESMKATGLWPRLMGRRRKSKIQQAYGHHLKTALDEMHGPNHKIPIEVREISDSEMFQMMARENQSEFDTTPVQNLITVKELLAACARGEIQLSQSKNKSRISRLAEIRVNFDIISAFLGWPLTIGEKRLNWVCDALDLMDAKLLKPKELDGLGEYQVMELVREATRRKEQAEWQAREAEQWAEKAKQEEKEATSAAEKKEAKKTHEFAQQQAQIHREHAKTAARTIITEVGGELRSGEIGAKQVRDKAFEAVPPPFEKKKTIPPINQFADQLALELNRVLSKSDAHREKLLAIADNQEHLSGYAREMLLGALQSLSERVSHWISRLDPKPNNGSRTPVKSAGPKRLKS